MSYDDFINIGLDAAVSAGEKIAVLRVGGSDGELYVTELSE